MLFNAINTHSLYCLEEDLLNDVYICQKVKTNKIYAQQVYAALCNNSWQKNEVISILKDSYWSCSWRHASEIVAEMSEEGDYLDWYCSGAFIEIKLTELDNRDIFMDYVEEGMVTKEVLKDFLSLGWKLFSGAEPSNKDRIFCKVTSQDNW